jgi:hypothetical protein
MNTSFVKLQGGARADTAPAITAFAFNLIMLRISSATAASLFQAHVRVIVLDASIVLSVTINAVAVAGLILGWRMRQRLLRMYADTQVDRYYDPSLLQVHHQRYWLVTMATATLGVATIVVLLAIAYGR